MTSKKKNLAVEQGSVLAIPLQDGEWALGQVIYPGIKFYIGVVLDKFREPLKKENINGKKLEFFSWTNDGELYNKNWQNLGIFDLQNYGILPNYKLGAGSDAIVENFYGERIRKYDEKLDANLSYKTVRSPMSFQRAVQAVFGIGEWRDSYASMRR